MESILIADYEIDQCTVLTEELKEAGYKAEYVCNTQEVFEYLSANQADKLLLDLNMPVKNWFEVSSELNRINNKVIILTAYTDLKSAFDAVKIWTRYIIRKPYDFNELHTTIKKILMREIVRRLLQAG